MSFLTQTENCGPLSDVGLKVNIVDNFYRHCVHKYESSKVLIDSYNYFIDNILPHIFIGEYSIFSSVNTEEIKRITEVFVDFPINEKNDTPEKITPRIARALRLSYFSFIYVKVESKISFGTGTTSKVVKIGSIPTMVGCNRCVTSHKPDEFESIEDWNFYLGECPSFSGGYFINKGAEKSIIYQEKLRTCNYFTAKAKGKDKHQQLTTLITCVNKSETTLIKLETGKKIPRLKVILAHTKGYHYPFYLIFYILWSKHIKNGAYFLEFNVRKIDDIILNFVPNEERNEVSLCLEPSRDKFFKRFTNVINKETKVDDIKIQQYVNKKLKWEKDLTFDIICEKVMIDLFKQCPAVEDKVANLCYMGAQHVRCFLKNRSLDERDSWANKKVDSPSRLVESLVNAIFNSTEGIKNKFYSKLETVQDEMGNEFKKSFNSYQWGYGKKTKKDNVAEAFKNDTLLASRSQKGKINTPTDRRIKSSSVRNVSATSMGIICPAETPDGESCGLVKHLSSTTHISYNRFYEFERNIISSSFFRDTDYMSNLSFGTKCKNQLFINGVLVHVYVSDKFYSAVKKQIRTIDKNDDKIIITFNEETTSQGIRHWSGNIINLNIPKRMYAMFDGLFQIINDSCSLKKIGDYNYCFSINGDILTIQNKNFYPIVIWIVPDKICFRLRNQRREGKLPRDACINKNEIDNIVQYYDDSGRPMTPLLIVDSEGDCVADKKNLWDFVKFSDYENSSLYIDYFFEQGGLELIDVKEFDSIFLAETVDEVRAFSKFRKFLNNLPDSNKKRITIDVRECHNYMAKIRMDYLELLKLTDDFEFSSAFLKDKFDFFLMRRFSIKCMSI